MKLGVGQWHGELMALVSGGGVLQPAGLSRGSSLSGSSQLQSQPVKCGAFEGEWPEALLALNHSQCGTEVATW